MRHCLIYYDENDIIEIKGYGNYKEKQIYNEQKLADIVNFTKHFADENELEHYLIAKGFLPPSFIGQLGIAFYESKNSLPKILPYGIPYSKDAQLFNFEKLTSFYLAHLTDPDFMEAFFQKFYLLKKLPQFQYLLTPLENNYNYFLSNYLLPSETRTIMSDFLSKYTSTKSGYKKRNFSKIYNLAMFAINYKNKKQISNDINNKNNEDVSSLINHYEHLLQDENLPQEEKEAYELAIKNLQQNKTNIRERKLK